MNEHRKRMDRTDWFILGIPALAAVLLHLLAIRSFGYFRDEFYYLACADHPAFGYVDQPPLSILILKLVRMTLGDSLPAIRLLPALSHGLLVWMTGLLVRSLGGGRFATLLGCIAALAPVGNLFLFHYYSMNFLDILFWQILIYLVIRVIQTGNMRLWLLFGVVAGLGLQNKISILFLGFGLIAGFLLTPHRKILKDKNIWIGAALAGLLFLPYLIWNAALDWPMLEFVHNAKTDKMAAVSPAGFFMGQLLYNNPLAALIWIAGLGYLFFHPEGKTFRLFGWMYLAIYILFTFQQAKDYYLAAAYPVLFAAGAVIWERWLKLGWRAWFKPALILVLVLSIGCFAPFTLPILSVEKTIAYMQSIGIQGTAGENHEMGVLPQHFADMHGWEEMVKTVGNVYGGLTEEDKAGCLVYVRNYGEAGAVDLLGKKYGLPKATCAHNNYWYWGPPEWDGKVAIILGWSDNIQENLADLEQRFESVELGATFTNPFCMPYENNRHWFICRNANFDFKEIWQHEKHFN
jgi:hypothetical protein